MASISREQWGRAVSAEEVARRAGGRRKYNSARQFAATLRRAEVERMLGIHGDDPDFNERAAAALGVSVRTVQQDRQVITFWREAAKRTPYVVSDWYRDLTAPLSEDTLTWIMEDSAGERGEGSDGDGEEMTLGAALRGFLEEMEREDKRRGVQRG